MGQAKRRSATDAIDATDATDAMGGYRAALSILRAPQWLHFAVLPLAGLNRVALGSARDLLRGALAIGVAALLLGYAYGINAWADRGSDASSLKNPLAGMSTVPFEAKLVVVVAALLAFFAACFLGAWAILLSLVSLVAGTLYSVGPRLKALPILGAVCNAAIFVPLLDLAFTKESANPLRAVFYVTFIGLIFQNQLLHEAADVDEDVLSGDWTTARLLGPRGVRIVATVLAIPFGFLAYWLAFPSCVVGVAAVVAMLGGALVAMRATDFAKARRVHRYVAAAFGAVLYVLGLFL